MTDHVVFIARRAQVTELTGRGYCPVSLLSSRLNATFTDSTDSNQVLVLFKGFCGQLSVQRRILTLKHTLQGNADAHSTTKCASIGVGIISRIPAWTISISTSTGGFALEIFYNPQYRAQEIIKMDTSVFYF